MNRSSSSSAKLAVLGLACLLAASARAVTNTWYNPNTSGNQNWTTDANWNGGAGPAPLAGDDLLWTGTAAVNPGSINNDYASGTVFSSLSFTLQSPWKISGNDVTLTNANAITILNGGAQNGITLYLNVNYNNPAPFVQNPTAPSANKNVTFNGNQDNLGNPLTFNITGANGGCNITVLGQIIGSGGLARTGTGAARLILGSSASLGNTYNGPTTISGGAIQLGYNEMIPSGYGCGNMTVNSDGRFDLNGYNETINGLFGSGVVTNSANGYGTLTVGDNDTTSAFNGTLGGNLNLTKTGAGTFTLTTANTIPGVVTLNGGALAVTSSAAFPNARLDFSGGGTLSFGSLTSFTNSGIINSGTFLLQNGSSAPVAWTVGASLVPVANYTTTASLTGSGSVTKMGTSRQNLYGFNTYSGKTTVSAGTLGLNYQHSGAGAVSVADGATLAVSVTPGTTLYLSSLTNGSASGSVLALEYDSSLPTVAALNVTSLTVNGSLTLNVAGTPPLAAGTTYPLAAYSGSILGGGSINLGTLPAGIAGHLQVGSGAINLVVDAVVNSLTWSGAAGNGLWNTNTINWLYSDFVTPTNYANQYGAIPVGDIVLFEDSYNSGSQFDISLTTNLRPATVTVNSGNTYTFSGVGKLTGTTTRLTQAGPGTLRIQTTNDYSGGTTLSGGILQLGAPNAIGTGQLTMSGGTISSDSATAWTVTNAFRTGGSPLTFGDLVNTGKLTFTRPVDLNGNNRTLFVNSDVSLSGGTLNGGTLTSKQGPGTLTVSGQNDWSASTAMINQLAGTLVFDGGAVITSQGFQMNASAAAGAGAVVRLVITNGAAFTNTGVANDLQLAYNSTLTTVTNQADLAGIVRFPNANASHGNLLLSRGPTGGTGSIAIANLLAGGDVEFNSIQKVGTTTPGYAEFNFNGGILRALGNSTSFLQGLDRCTIRSGGATNDTRSFSIAIAQNLLEGTPGGGGLTEIGNGTLLLNGTNTYTGDTLVTSGTLGGSGVIAGNVNVSGGTLSPGAGIAISTLTIGGNLWATNQAVFSLNKKVSPSNSLAVVTGTIHAGGTLTVTNIGTGTGSALAAGDSFQLFNKAVSGSFTTLNLPPPPSAAVWTNKLAIDGSIALYSTQPAPASIGYTLSGGNLVLTWPNGAGWNLQVQTNTPSTGLGTNWTPIPGATSPYSFTVDPANGSVFYRLSYP